MHDPPFLMYIPHIWPGGGQCGETVEVIVIINHQTVDVFFSSYPSPSFIKEELLINQTMTMVVILGEVNVVVLLLL